MATDPRSWGILGDPTPEQVQCWCDLPVGEFRRMTQSMRQKRVKAQLLQVQVSKIETETKTVTATLEYSGTLRKDGIIENFDEQVLAKVKDGSMSLNWSEPVQKNHIEYRYRAIAKL